MPHTSPDGWVELRDEKGTLWAEYHPERKLLRRQKKLFGSLHVVTIPIDSLLDRTFKVNLSVEEIMGIKKY